MPVSVLIPEQQAGDLSLIRFVMFASLKALLDELIDFADHQLANDKLSAGNPKENTSQEI